MKLQDMLAATKRYTYDQTLLIVDMNTLRKQWEAFFLKYKEVTQDECILAYVEELDATNAPGHSWWAEFENGELMLRYNCINEEGNNPGSAMYSNSERIPSYEYLTSVPAVLAKLLAWTQQQQKRLNDQQKALNALQTALEGPPKKGTKR